MENLFFVSQFVKYFLGQHVFCVVLLIFCTWLFPFLIIKYTNCQMCFQQLYHLKWLLYNSFALILLYRVANSSYILCVGWISANIPLGYA